MRKNREKIDLRAMPGKAAHPRVSAGAPLHDRHRVREIGGSSESRRDAAISIDTDPSPSSPHISFLDGMWRKR
jgi:hypothetical protein